MANYIAVTIRNIKTKEEISFSLENNDIVRQAVGAYLQSAPKASIVKKLKEYVATDRVLTPIELLHAFGWSACFVQQSDFFKKRSNISVGWTFHEDLDAVLKFRQGYKQVMESNGAQKIFDTMEGM